jgi:outer membrane protein OmpA-like peptidoglycan-associated protein
MKFWQTVPFAMAALIIQAQATPDAPSVPLYRVTVVQNSAKAINYGQLKGSTKIDFQGTVLAPKASGEAKVKLDAGGSRIKAEFKGLPPASTFGGEYLTYVLWGISTEGRATNLGEIVLNKHGKGELKATDALQTFGLLVTAEPYFAVSQPSDVVVLENVARKSSKEQVEYIDAKFSLLKRGQYNLNLDNTAPLAMDDKTPFDVYQARNAVRIARAAGGTVYAPTAMDKAETNLKLSEAENGGTKLRIREARESVQSSEDARLIAVQRQEAEQVLHDQKQAQDQVDAANQQAAQANQDAAQANAAQAEALQQAAQATAGQDAALQQAAQASAAEADALKQAQQAEAANEGLRAELLAQFNAVLQTRLTARGLIVNMSGVLFQTGKATLLPAAREKLAKVAGILSTHKGLVVEADGFTDSTGSADFNQRLSGQRAENVRNYLVSQGVSGSSISSKGFGKENPIADNGTMAGRQENRRVELVVSGAGITEKTVSMN